MKKLLLATSILAGTAGLAAAEITLSGDARMGFLDDFVYAEDLDDDVEFTSRARVTFTFSGETDGGLSFGASFRADNSESAAGGEAGSVFLSGAWGKVSMGDVDGAALAAVGHVDGVGLTGLSDLNESSFIGNGGLNDDDLTDADISGSRTLTDDPAVLYEYTTGNIGMFVSITNPGHESSFDFDGNDVTVNTEAVDGVAWALGANYSTDAYKFGIGYEDLDVDSRVGPGNLSADHLFLGADATFGAFTGKLRYGMADVSVSDGVDSADIDFEQWSISGTYAMDAVAVTGFYMDKQFDNSDGSNRLSRESFGIGASYDLGGGAKVVGGIVDSNFQDSNLPENSDTAFDFGVSFSF